MKPVVFDSSAILADLLGEPGGDAARSHLANGAISTVNLAEIVAYFARNGVRPSDIDELLRPIPVERVPFTEELAVAAGLLASETKDAGLSLGDRACLALARDRKAAVLTSDRAWSKIKKSLGFDIVLIR
jgi:ribonuclease VapC